MNTEEKFERLVENFLRQMECVKASRREYIEALEYAISEVQVHIQAAVEDQRCEETE